MAQIQYPAGVDVHYNGTLSARTMSIPASAVGNSQIVASAGIAATKVVHQHAISHEQAGGTAVVAQTVAKHIFRGAAEIIAVEVVPLTVPTGGDLAYTVDVQKGNASSAFASILSSVVTVNSSSTTRTIQAGTITTDDAADGDTLQVVVAVSGSTGTQGQGFVVTIWVREEP